MSERLPKQDPWAEFDAKAVRSEPWPKIGPPTAEQRAAWDRRNNPMGLELPEGWRWLPKVRRYFYQDGDLTINAERSGDHWSLTARDGGWRLGAHGDCDDDRFVAILAEWPAFVRKQRDSFAARAAREGGPQQ